MQIELGKTSVSLLNPPNDGQLIDNTGATWQIKRNGAGLIVLRQAGCCHPDFLNGMDLLSFCQWINDKAQ